MERADRFEDVLLPLIDGMVQPDVKNAAGYAESSDRRRLVADHERQSGSSFKTATGRVDHFHRDIDSRISQVAVSQGQNVDERTVGRTTVPPPPCLPGRTISMGEPAYDVDA